jgi:Xaa-Pro dipeptidase
VAQGGGLRLRRRDGRVRPAVRPRPGLGLHERPIISRLNSLDNPVEIQTGMVFALETYCPASDGFSAARIEEEVVVTEHGAEVLTRFPAQDLFIANEY